MNEKRIHFLSGLPRTGSTLLGSLLNQNPHVYVSPTSPLYPLLNSTNEEFNVLNLQYTFDQKGISDKVYRSLVDAFYPQDREFPIVFDKHRGWPKHVDAIREFIDQEPRIVCTVRPIAEIIASYITLADRDPDNFIDAHLKRDGQEVTNEARAFLLWSFYLKVPYECMIIGLKMHPESLLLIEYDQLAFEPERAMQRVYDFCGMEPFEHNFEDIENSCAEAKDEAWGLKDLHAIRSTVCKTSVDPLEYLPRAAIDYFSQFDLREVSWA